MRTVAPIPACLLRAWQQHERELCSWLGQQLREPDQVVVDQLTACLPRVLAELDSADRDILTRCDIGWICQVRE